MSPCSPTSPSNFSRLDRREEPKRPSQIEASMKVLQAKHEGFRGIKLDEGYSLKILAKSCGLSLGLVYTT